jgi:hypothetical protein
MSYQFRLLKGLLIIYKENVRQLAQTKAKLEKATGKLGQTNAEALYQRTSTRTPQP